MSVCAVTFMCFIIGWAEMKKKIVITQKNDYFYAVDVLAHFIPHYFVYCIVLDGLHSITQFAYKSLHLNSICDSCRWFSCPLIFLSLSLCRSLPLYVNLSPSPSLFAYFSFFLSVLIVSHTLSLLSYSSPS